MAAEARPRPAEPGAGDGADAGLETRAERNPAEAIDPAASGVGPAIVVDDVWKSFRIYRQRAHSLKETILARRSKYEEFWALKGISFTVDPGEMLGIVGPNGSGKSTLLKCMARILTPEAGSIETRGTLSSLLELGTGFHPELSGRENVYLAGSILGLRRDEIDAKFDSIQAFSGLSQFIDTPIKNYSSGMVARLAFSVAISIDPEVLLVDEVLAVGDEAFQLKCYEHIWKQRAAGKTVVFVSHSLDAVRRLCSKVVWIENGEIRNYGDTSEVIEEYQQAVRKAEAIRRGDAKLEGGRRWGNQKIKVTGVHILGPSGESTTLVRSGDRVTFRVEYESSVDAGSVVFTMKIYRADDRTCVTGVNSLTHPDGDSFTVRPGPGYVDYVVNELPMWRGNFTLTVGIGDEAGGVTYDWHTREFPFMVVPGNFPQGDGVFYLAGEWAPQSGPAPASVPESDAS